MDDIRFDAHGLQSLPVVAKPRHRLAGIITMSHPVRREKSIPGIQCDLASDQVVA